MVSQWHKTKRRRRPGGFEPRPRISDMQNLAVIGAIIGSRTFHGDPIGSMGKGKTSRAVTGQVEARAWAVKPLIAPVARVMGAAHRNDRPFW